MTPAREEPEVVTYRIPRIEVYQVTDDELKRVEDGLGHVGQDLIFAVASLSFCIAFAITLVTVTLSERLFAIFLSLVVIASLIALYTGIRLWRARGETPNGIAAIRSRKAEPAVPAANQP